MAADHRLQRLMELMITFVIVACMVNLWWCPSTDPLVSRVAEVPCALAVVAAAVVVVVAAAAAGPTKAVELASKVAAETITAVVTAAVVSPCTSKSGPGTQIQSHPRGGQRCPGTCTQGSAGSLLFCLRPSLLLPARSAGGWH